MRGLAQRHRLHVDTRTRAAPATRAFPRSQWARLHMVKATGASNDILEPITLQHGAELDDHFTGLAQDGLMTVAGFGSLLSITSSRVTFPDLVNFRTGKVHGFRRVFAHTADVFFARGIANAATTEISSLSCEPCEGQEVVVSLFEVPAGPAAIDAFIRREHEFRFVAVRPTDLAGAPVGRAAVLCAMYTDEEYRLRRCPPDEWARRWGVHGIERVWRDDVLPCRVYLRHCVLAARKLGPEAEASFLDSTFLSDRVTTIRQHLAANPAIMLEPPPEEWAARYNG